MLQPAKVCWVCLVLALLVPGIGLGQNGHPAPTVSPALPADVSIPVGHMGNPIAFFDDFSWQEFIALNWPAKAGVRGEPEPAAALGSASEAVVWESWKADHELFLPGGGRPAAWDNFASVSPCVDLSVDQAGRTKVLSWSADAHGTAMAHFNQAGIGAPLGTLVAQNRTYVRYEIRMNRIQYEFIRGADADKTKWLYLRENLPRDLPDKPPAESLVFPSGSIELKAAWRQFLPSEQAQQARYFVRKARLVHADGKTCTDATMGLIGLHIVHRTPTMREWVWSTFEHVDNLTDAPTDVAPTLTDRTGPQVPADPAVNKLLPIVDSSHPPQPDPDPVQVVRVKPIHDSTAKTNSLYREHAKVKGTVWANYRLIMTQWPTMPAPDDTAFKGRVSKPLPAYPADAGTPFPVDTNPMGTSIANVSMETTGFVQQTQSCMRCHLARPPQPAGKPSLPKTEFVWFLRLRAFPTDGQPEQNLAKSLQEFSNSRLLPAE